MLTDTSFNSRAERAFLGLYRRFFSIEEIEKDKTLKWVFGATILSYFLSFNSWIKSSAVTIDAYVKGTHTCWPYFQGCGEWLFLRALPDGYSQTLLYMSLFGTLVLAVYLMYRSEWTLAHVALVPSFVWHVLGVFVLTESLGGNYDYYLFLFALVLLFFPHKLFFLKLIAVLLYFLAASIKIHEGWILGTYFSALKTGLPLFPKWSIPIWTNLVIFMQVVGSWFLLSQRNVLQRTALFFFVAFHLYSGLIVEYRYPATILPTLLILFGPMYRHTPLPVDRKSIIGWILIGSMIVAQSVSVLIPGDVKLTLEGNKFGLYMFEANHQCISTATIMYKDGHKETTKKTGVSARHRCDPYQYWFRLNTLCKRVDLNVDKILWTFDHSINGGPFLRIVEVPNACELSYRPFRHNWWIKTEKDSPEAVGFPVENLYY